MIKAFVVGLVLSLFGFIVYTNETFATPAAALDFNTHTVVVSDDDGGGIEDYIRLWETVRQLDGKIKVDGRCISACTLLLGLIPKDHICSTPYGFFGFHSATMGEDFSKEGTRLVWNTYPDWVIEKIQAKDPKWNGDTSDDPHPQLVYVRGQDLVQACE